MKDTQNVKSAKLYKRILELHSNKQFLEATRDAYLYQHVKFASRGRGTNKPSILDLFFKDEKDNN